MLACASTSLSSPESFAWHDRDGRMEDKVAYLQRLFGLQVDADTSLDTGSLDASGTNVSLEANEL